MCICLRDSLCRSCWKNFQVRVGTKQSLCRLPKLFVFFLFFLYHLVVTWIKIIKKLDAGSAAGVQERKTVNCVVFCWKNAILLLTSCSVSKARYRHIHQSVDEIYKEYWNSSVVSKLVASSMMWVTQLEEDSKHAYLRFSGRVATQTRWGGKLSVRLEARICSGYFVPKITKIGSSCFKS